jgi:hypothetical protein
LGTGIAPAVATAFAITAIATFTARYRNCTAGSLFYPAAIAFWPANGLIRISASVIATASTPPVMIAAPLVTITPPSVVTPSIAVPTIAIPALAPVTPIMAMMIAHREASAIIIKDVVAVAGVIIIFIPTAAKADIIETIAAVAGIIAVPRCIGIAIIIALVAIAEAKSRVIDAA